MNWQSIYNKGQLAPFLLAKLNFFESLSKPALKALTIAASTVAVVELLKQDYSVGISASISWLLLVIASKRIFKWNAYYLHRWLTVDLR